MAEHDFKSCTHASELKLSMKSALLTRHAVKDSSDVDEVRLYLLNELLLCQSIEKVLLLERLLTELD